MRSAMLGATDSMIEREDDEEEPMPQLASWRTLMQKRATKTLTGEPFQAAIEEFGARNIVPRETFDQLTDAAKKKAFTVAGLAAEELLADAHAELARQVVNSKEKSYFDEATGKWVYKGPILRDFQKFARDRLEKAGWTPANPSHVETVFRTNVLSAYSSGRIIETTQPTVLALRPYWQIIGVNDSRQRKTHKKAQGTILAADHPFWRTAYPPFGFSCRCRVVSRSKRWVDAHGGPTRVPDGLPDKGFTSGIDASLVPKLAVPTEGQREPTAPKPPRPLDAPGLLPKTPKPQFAPKPVPFQPTTVLAPIEVQKPMPVAPVTPATTAREIMGTQLAGPGGSNPGGLFLGTDGKKRYVKVYADSAQAAGEHVANKLYADLGLGRVKSQVFESNGQLAYASEFIEGAKPIGIEGLTPELAKKALDGLVGDMVTANWDAAGLKLDNLVVTKSGQVLRIDNGGTFLMRAQAGRKPAELLNALPEWDGFFSSEINPSYAKLASVAGVNSPADMLPEIRKQLKAIRDLRAKSGSWLSYIEKHAPGLAADDAAAIAQMLESRTAAIAEKIRETQAAIDAVEVAAKRAAKRANTAKVAFRDIQEAEPIPTGVPVPGVENPSAAAPNELFKKTEEFRNKTVTRAVKVFTPEESQSINQFTQGSDDIRAALKLDREAYEIRRQSDQFMRGYDEARADGERINAAIAKARASTEERPELVPKELFRGMRDLNKAKFDELVSQQEIVWDQPTSTSWNPESAKFFYTPEGRETYSIYYRITPSKDPNGIAIEGISDARTEREILYGSGSKFRVTKVVRDTEFDRGAIMYLEEI